MVADGRWPPRVQVRGVNEPLLKVGRATITENVNGSAGSEASTTLVELEIDEWIHMGRGEGRRFCGWPATTVIVFAGVGFYGMPAALIMAPAYLDRELEREWFGGDGNEGSTQLFAVSSAFFMVWGLAAFAFTWAADQYGRKPLLVAVGLLGLLLNASNAAAPNFGTYAVLHPLTAVAIGPSGAISYVLSAEWTSPCDLSLLTLLLNSSFSLSSCLVAGLCALGLPWRKMQMLLGLFVALPLLGLPFVPESPRYLLAKGRCAQAESVLRVALRRAGVAPPPLHVTLKPLTSARVSAVASDLSTTHASCSSGSVQAATVHADAHADDSQCGDASLPGSSSPGHHRGHGQCGSLGLLLRPPTLCRMLIVSWCWLAVGLLYYGLNFAIGACDEASGCNPYQHGALMGLVDIPGYVCAYVLTDHPRFGRRTTLALCFLVGGSCLMLTPLVSGELADGTSVVLITAPVPLADAPPTPLPPLAPPLPPPSSQTIVLALALIGKACAAGAFQLVYMYPTELFPTAIRASALGVAEVFSRTGSILAPLTASPNMPPLVTQLGLGAVALSAGLLALLLPETRGRPLAEERG